MPESLDVAIVTLLSFSLFTVLVITAVYTVIKAAVRQGTLEAHRRLDRERAARELRGERRPV